MKLNYTHWLLAAGLILGGCQSLPNLVPAADAPRVANANLDARIGELPAQRLTSGDCGIFLWSRTPERRLLFFAKSRDGVSRMMIDGREQDIPRTAFGGDNVMGQSAQQTYTWRDIRVDVAVTFDRRPGFERGAVVPQGTLTVTNRDGWDYVMPVGGLIACEK